MSKEHISLHSKSANKVGPPGMLPLFPGCDSLLLVSLGVLCRCPAPVLSAGVDVSVAFCCIASALASQQLQCCLPPLASALQTTEASGKRADKWLYTGPRRITLRVGPKVLGHRTVSDAASYVSPEEGTAPLASLPPSRGDSGDTPPPQVSMCPACSAASSLRTVDVPTPRQHTLMSVTRGC